MGKIGDLWVKLGLKKDEFDAGMKASEGKIAGFGKTLKGIGTVAAAAWAAIGAGAVALADKFAHQSQRFGDAWDQTMSGMKAAWQTFITTISSWDWDGLGDRISAAFGAAKRNAAAQDSVFEVENSIKLRRGAIQDELAQLQIEMRATSNSYEQRKEAAQKYLDAVKPLYEEEIKLREKLKLTQSDLYLAQAKVPQTATNRELLRTLITNIAPDGDLLSNLAEYNKRNTGNGDSKLSRDELAAVEQFLGQYTAREAGALTALASYYQNTNDKRTQALVDAIAGADAASAAYNEETRRVQMVLNQKETATGTGSSKSEPGYLKAIDWLKYINIDQLDQVIDEANKEIEENLGDIKDIKIETEDFVPSDAAVEYFQKLAAAEQDAVDRANALKEAVASGLAEGLQELTDQIVGLDEVNAGAVFQSLLSPLADMAIQEGKIVLMQGLAVEAVGKSLSSLHGAPAIAAGAALMAIGAAAKSGLSALASSGSSSTTSSSSASSASSSTQNIESELTVYVKGTIKGSDIVISGSKTQKSWAR